VTGALCFGIRAQQNWSIPVTNRLALILGLFLSAALIVDVLLFGQDHLLFLGKKLFDLIEWLAFWR
jgi:hypothetical protein